MILMFRFNLRGDLSKVREAFLSKLFNLTSEKASTCERKIAIVGKILSFLW